MAKKKSGHLTSEETGRMGGKLISKKYGKNHFKNLAHTRWGNHCERCGKSEKIIAAEKLPCIYKVEKTSKTHIFPKKS